MAEGDSIMTIGYGLGMLLLGMFAIALAGGLFLFFTNTTQGGDDDSGSK